MDQQLWDFVTEVERATTQSCLEDELRAVMNASGFELFTYLEIQPNEHRRDSYRVTTYPQDWTSHYTEMAYRDVDPSVLLSKRGLEIVVWPPETFTVVPQRTLAEFYDKSRQFGITSGFTVPVHGPGAVVAMLTAATDAPKSEIEHGLLRDQGAWRMIVASTFVTSMRLRKPEVEEVRLSPREAECLLWTARGKTANEIATILSIAERTVVQHLTNACRKFDVYSKHMAVIKAVMSGLITP
ncbi:MAG: LuxR family transcriptional regulator [Alphaproteobacteria bacterium]|nr:LuxR family transcriptional regulator [Alphaproteobacteria bacterium]